jgi:hypothetical protein
MSATGLNFCQNRIFVHNKHSIISAIFVDKQFIIVFHKYVILEMNLLSLMSELETNV